MMEGLTLLAMWDQLVYVWEISEKLIEAGHHKAVAMSLAIPAWENSEWKD